MIALALGVAAPAGCIREALPDLCPNVEVGELVISELRGSQAEPGAVQYIEIYNGAGKTVDLEGLVVRQFSAAVNDSDDKVIDVLVRESIEVEAGGYAVLGLAPDGASWLDYEVSADVFVDVLFRESLGSIELRACGEVIDEVFFDPADLPQQGTRACGPEGGPPSADDNDDTGAGCWCDDVDDFGGGAFGLGKPGTPGEANRCSV